MGLLAARPPRVEKLKKRGDVTALIGAAGHRDESADGGADVRARAIAALVDFDHEGVSEALVQALADPVESVRDAAIAALVARGPKRAVAPMCAAATLWTGPGQASARNEVVTALEAMRDPDASERVAKSMVVRPAELDEADREVIERLTRAAPGSRGRIVDQMMLVLGDREGGPRATRMLIWTAPDSVEALLGALGDQRKRDQAMLALGEIHATEAVEPLCGLMLESWDPAVRRRAAWALGEIRDLRGVEALVLATGDGDYDVRTEAGSAFDKFGNVGMAIALTAMVPQAALGPGRPSELAEVDEVRAGEDEAEAAAVEEEVQAVDEPAAAEPPAGADTEVRAVVPAEAGAAEPDEQPATNAERPTVAADQPTVAADQQTVAADQQTVATDRQTVATDQPTVAIEQQTVATDQPTATTEQPTVPDDRPAPPTQAVVPALRRLLQRRGEL